MLMPNSNLVNKHTLTFGQKRNFIKTIQQFSGNKGESAKPKIEKQNT